MLGWSVDTRALCEGNDEALLGHGAGDTVSFGGVLLEEAFPPHS